MNALLAFLLSVGGSLLSYTFIAVWYVVPRLSKQPREEGLIPLILLNTFRTVGLVFLFPQVTGERCRRTLPSLRRMAISSRPA